MLRIIATWVAKLVYVFRQDFTAATADLHAGLAAQNAAEKRGVSERLIKEAEEMEKRIADFAEMEEKGYWLCEDGHEKPDACSCAHLGDLRIVHSSGCRFSHEIPMCNCGKPMKHIARSEMSGQEKYESDKERKDAEKIAAEKRQQAAAEAENAKGSEDTVKYFRSQAASGRAVADKVRQL